MEISNLIEITPGFKAELLRTLKNVKELADCIGGAHITFSIVSDGHSSISIYDRKEGDLGFYAHDIDEKGNVKLKFVNSAHTPEADLYEKAFIKETNPELYKAIYEEDSDE